MQIKKTSRSLTADENKELSSDIVIRITKKTKVEIYAILLAIHFPLLSIPSSLLTVIANSHKAKSVQIVSY